MSNPHPFAVQKRRVDYAEIYSLYLGKIITGRLISSLNCLDVVVVAHSNTERYNYLHTNNIFSVKLETSRRVILPPKVSVLG